MHFLICSIWCKIFEPSKFPWTWTLGCPTFLQLTLPQKYLILRYKKNDVSKVSEFSSIVYYFPLALQIYKEKVLKIQRKIFFHVFPPKIIENWLQALHS